MPLVIVVAIVILLELIINGYAVVALSTVPIGLFIIGVCLITSAVSNYKGELEEEYQGYKYSRESEASHQRHEILIKEEQTEQEMSQIRVPIWFNQNKYYLAVYSFTMESLAYEFFEAPENYLTAKEFSHILVELWKKYPTDAEVKEYIRKWQFLMQEKKVNLIEGKYKRVSNIDYINKYCIPFKHRYSYVEPSPMYVESLAEFEEHSEALRHKRGIIGTAMVMFVFCVLSIIVIAIICA